MRKLVVCGVAALFAVTVASAAEVVTFYDVYSQAASGMVSYPATLMGGYMMGALNWTGTVSPLHGSTYGSELRCNLNGPLGAATLTLGTGTTFANYTVFSGVSNVYAGDGDPAGAWTFDFYESYDDGGDGQPDAIWHNISFTFNEGQPPPQYLWKEEFEGGIPANWTLSGYPWYWTTNNVCGRPNYTGGTGLCADADSDYWYSYPYDTRMITHQFTVPTANPTLEFDASYNDIGGADIAQVNISTDGGATWQNLINWNTDQGAYDGVHVSVNLAQFAGQNAMIEFRYAGTGWDWWFEVDNVGVTPEPASLLLLGLAALALRRR